jgi:hypothetical protein
MVRSGRTTYDTCIDLDSIIYLEADISFQNERHGCLEQE